MTIDNLIQGLQILRKYFEEDSYHVSVSHDNIMVSNTDYPVSKEDYQLLISLAWYQGENQIDGARYDPGQYWSAFV